VADLAHVPRESLLQRDRRRIEFRPEQQALVELFEAEEVIDPSERNIVLRFPSPRRDRAAQAGAGRRQRTHWAPKAQARRELVRPRNLVNLGLFGGIEPDQREKNLDWENDSEGDDSRVAISSCSPTSPG